MNIENKKNNLSLLIIGSTGQLGQSMKYFNNIEGLNFQFLNRENFNMENHEDIF